MNRKFLTLLAIAAFAACYGTVIKDLVEMWSTQPVYSFGFVLPFVSGYIVWARRDKIRDLDLTPDLGLGFTVTLLALGLLIVGHVGSIVGLTEASMVAALAGLILVSLGRRALAFAWFPLAYLLLGMAIWDGVIGRLQAPSQLLSGSIAVGILRVIGIPALHDGMKIVIPSVTLEVMRECSGVNQLMTIVAMTVPAASLLLRGAVRRVSLVFLGMAISYLSNGVRIALVGVLAYHGLGDGNLQGAHLLEGLVVSLFGYVLLFACFTVLSKGQDEEVPQGSSSSSPRFGWPTFWGTQSRPSWGQAGTLAVMLFVGVFLLADHPAEIVLRHDLDGFPTRIGEWTVDTIPEPFANRFPAVDDATVRAYPTATGERRFVRGDDELTRVYRNAAGDRVRLFIGYHRSQHEGKELAGEMSSLLANVALPISLPLGVSTVKVNEVTTETATKRRTVLYWYVLNGRIVNDMRLAKMYMVWDAIAHRRTNGAVVMLGWESTPVSGAELSRRKALDLAAAVFPLLTQYLPSTTTERRE